MIELLRLFGKEIEGCKTCPFEEVNKMSLKKGYLVKEEACTVDVEKYIDSISVNPNSTFYKTWNDIISKDRFELILDQLLHYASTYGTDFNGTPYIPNDGNISIPDMNNIKVIDTITMEDAANRLCVMLYSGIALKQETLNDIMSVIKKMNISDEISIDKVKNKEAKMLLYDIDGKTPNEAEEFARFLIYKATGSTLLIKSKEVIEAIKESCLPLSYYITKENINMASSVFFRYKPIFLAFKHNKCKGNAGIVNRLRKLAIKNNKPKVPSFWSNCLMKASFDDILTKAHELNNFKKIALIETCRARLAIQYGYYPYIIRNGKVYMKETQIFPERYHPISEILYQSLINSLRKKACSVKLPKYVNLTLPRSEKSFIGDYPLYTEIPIDKDTIVGIYWRNEWGAHDLDLSFIDAKNLNKIGWNSDFYDNDVCFSGDMTDAEPEATELLYFKKRYSGNGIIHVNRFYGNEGSGYNLFVAKEHIEDKSWKENYMCNPDNIILKAHDTMDSKEKSIAIMADGKLYLALLRTGNKRVSVNGNITTEYAHYILNTRTTHLMLEKVLKDAGFTIVGDNDKADIDFSVPTKDKFIQLLS